MTKLVRGDAIATVVASRNLYGRDDKLAVGDTVIVAIEPGAKAAETVYCVRLPARQGAANRIARIDPADAERALAEIAAGCMH